MYHTDLFSMAVFHKSRLYSQPKNERDNFSRVNEILYLRHISIYVTMPGFRYRNWRKNAIFFSICKQKRKILTLMCSRFHPFSTSPTAFGKRHMHHNSYRGNIFNLFFIDIFFGVFSAQISLLMVITIHYKFRSFHIAGDNSRRKKMPTHSFIFLLLLTHFLSFLSGPENNLISCVL